MWKRYSADITHRWDLTGFDTCEVSFFMQNWVNNFLNVSFFLWHNSIPISFSYICNMSFFESVPGCNFYEISCKTDF